MTEHWSCSADTGSGGGDGGAISSCRAQNSGGRGLHSPPPQAEFESPSQSLASFAAQFNHRVAGLVSSTRWELKKAYGTPSPVRVSKGQKAQSNARDHWKEILGEKKQWKGGLVHSLWSQTLRPLELHSRWPSLQRGPERFGPHVFLSIATST